MLAHTALRTNPLAYSPYRAVAAKVPGENAKIINLFFASNDRPLRLRLGQFSIRNHLLKGIGEDVSAESAWIEPISMNRQYTCGFMSPVSLEPSFSIFTLMDREKVCGPLPPSNRANSLSLKLGWIGISGMQHPCWRLPINAFFFGTIAQKVL